MSAEYFDGFGFGLTEEPVTHVEDAPHTHFWPTRPWRVRDFPGMEIYDCACGVRRMVPIGVHPDDGEDYPVLPFPESCPLWSANYVTPPSLLLSLSPEINPLRRETPHPSEGYNPTWPNAS